MSGEMIEFDDNGAQVPGYLAIPASGNGPGVVVLHAWWGLTEPFRQVCDRLAQAGYLALAPDLYRGKTAATVEEAAALGSALDQRVEQWRGDIAGAARYLLQHHHDTTPGVTASADVQDEPGTVALLGFSLGGAYALDMSVNLADEVAAVVVFYDAYAEPDFKRAQAAYLLHYAEDDTFVPAEKVTEIERMLEAAGRSVTVHVYPGTKHWFFEANRPDAYDAHAATLAWERTIAFLNAELR